jgi:hypothetical protein
MPLFCRTAALPLHLWQGGTRPQWRSLLQLKKMCVHFVTASELFEDKAGQPGDGEEMDDSDDEKLSPTDIEHAICLAMRRLNSVQEMGPCCSAGRRWKESSGDSELIVSHKAVAEIIAKRPSSAQGCNPRRGGRTEWIA